MLKPPNCNKRLVFHKSYGTFLLKTPLLRASLLRALLLSVLLTLLTNTHAAQINVDSSIKAVTVYPDSAKITRVAKVSLAVGKNDIVINNLPLNLDELSLRVSGEGKGKGSISLGSVKFSRNIQYDVVQQQEKSIRDLIEKAQDERRIVEDSITRNRAQLEYINKMVLGNSNALDNKRKSDTHNGSYANLPLNQWQQAWQTLDEATAKAQEKIRQFNKALKKSSKQLTKLKRELQQVATNQKESRVATLHIHTDTAAELRLNLDYQIRGARWEPVYDADLNTKTASVQLKTLAQISQRTGEDWNNVNVTLSTLRPNAGTQLPQLKPWVLDFMPEPRAGVANRYNNELALGSLQEAPAIASTQQKVMRKSVTTPLSQQHSRLIYADFSAEYIVPNLISLSSGSNKRRFALSSQQLDSTIKLASSPRFDPRVMILATVKYQDEFPLLAGSISLYRNGNFVGATSLKQKLSGEKIELSFGEDDKVSLKFSPDPDKKRKDGLLFGKRKVVERHYKVSVTSNHSKPFPISISDVLPVASEESIKVKSLGVLPTKRGLDGKKGVVSWDKTLLAKTELQIQYGYSVSYPEDETVLGL